MAILYIRYVVANSAVVWHSSITVVDNVAIEWIQKVAFIIILRENYESYDQALKIIGLPSLKERRIIFCKKKGNQKHFVFRLPTQEDFKILQYLICSA